MMWTVVERQQDGSFLVDHHGSDRPGEQPGRIIVGSFASMNEGREACIAAFGDPTWRLSHGVPGDAELTWLGITAVTASGRAAARWCGADNDASTDADTAFANGSLGAEP